MRSLVFVFVVFTAVVVAACSGSNNQFVGVPPTKGTVAFTFVVPSPVPAAAKRDINLPSGATSVKITLDSVNGSPQPSSSPTVSNVSVGTNNVDVSAPAGDLVFTVSVYSSANAGGSPTSEGNLSVTATAGATVNAPATLSGTLSKIVITMGGAAELGASAQVPVVVQGEDANGYTILGTYTNPITLSDTDASSQTSLSVTNVPDSTTAAGVTLTYSGGVMSSAATIGASASGVSAGNVTTASFSPDATYPAAASSATFNQTTSYDLWVAGAVPQPTFSASDSASYTLTIESPSPAPSASPFDGISGLFELSYSNNTNQPDYYAWESSGSTQQLEDIGDINSNSSGTYTYYCSPGYISFEIPLPSSWNAYPSGTTCTQTNVNPGNNPPQNQRYVSAADGSYTYTFSYPYDSGTVSGTWQDDAEGNLTIVNDDPEGLNSNEGSYTLDVPAPTSDAATVTASLYPATGPTESPLPSPLPSPVSTTAPNPWLLLPASLHGMPPNPLQSDVYTNEGTIASSALPAQCTVSAGIIPSGGSLTQVQENLYQADPASQYLPLYAAVTTNYYYLAGVGPVCIVSNQRYYYFNGTAADWYDGSDQNLFEVSQVQYTSLTASSLEAELAHARSMTSAESHAAALLMVASREHELEMTRAFIATQRRAYAARSKRGG